MLFLGLCQVLVELPSSSATSPCFSFVLLYLIRIKSAIRLKLFCLDVKLALRVLVLDICCRKKCYSLRFLIKRKTKITVKINTSKFIILVKSVFCFFVLSTKLTKSPSIFVLMFIFSNKNDI